MIKIKNSLKIKILSLLVIPLAVIMGLALFIGGKSFITLQESKKLEVLTNLAPDISSLIHELQKERGISAVFLGGKGGVEASNKLKDQKVNTDSYNNIYAEQIRMFPKEEYGDKFLNLIDESALKLKKLNRIRSQVKNNKIKASEMASYYTSTISSLLSMVGEMAGLSSNSDITNYIAKYIVIIKAKEYMGQERAIGGIGFGQGIFTDGIYNKFIGLINKQEALLSIFNMYATKQEKEYYNITLTGKDVNEVARMRKVAISKNNIYSVPGSYWFETITGKINKLKKVEDNIKDNMGNVMSSVITVTLYKLIFLIVLLIAVSIINVISALSIVNGILKPVKGLEVGINELSNYDLSKLVEVQSSDEIAMMTEKFNNSINKLKELVENVRGSSNGILSSAEKMNETSTVINDMGKYQQESISQINIAIAESSEMINQIQTNSDDTVNSVNNIERSSSKANMAMTQLKANSKEILSVTSVIAGISNQINLLALNASIEAARAGDVGRGFAVVADEVGKLASVANKSTDEISKITKQLESDINLTDTSLSSISSAISSISSNANLVSESVAQQSVAMEEISSTVESFNDQVINASSKINESTELSNSVAKEALSLDKKVAKFKV